MKIRFILLLFLYLSGKAEARFLSTVREFYKERDYLGLRIFLKENFRQMTRNVVEWQEIRQIVMSTPEIGLDLVWYWDLNIPEKLESPKVKNVRQLVNRAETESLKKNWKVSQTLYERALEVMLQNKDLIKTNQQYYEFVLHMYARSLFSNGNYQKSLDVYSVISQGYFRFRQVLFEKMWAAFRSNNVGAALGAISSQKSIYMSAYLEPEAYVVLIYLYKKLCMDKQMEQLLEELKSFRKELTSGGTIDFSFGDLEHMVMKNLLSEKYLNYSSLNDKRLFEQNRIRQRLKKVEDSIKSRLIESIDKVLGYAKLAVSGVGTFERIKDWPDRGALMKKNLEIWPLKDGEEWLDEAGFHHYMGGHQCKK